MFKEIKQGPKFDDTRPGATIRTETKDSRVY